MRAIAYIYITCHFTFSQPFTFHKKKVISTPTTTLQFNKISLDLTEPRLLLVLKVKCHFLYSRMRTDVVDANAPTSNDTLPALKLLDSSLRVCVIPLSAATIWLTVTNQQDNSIYGKLEFSNLMGLKYMVCISAICGTYAFIAAISTWVRCLVTKAWLFFVSDQIVAYLMVTSGAAVLEILYLAYKGDREVSWSEACSYYGRFCSRMKVALVLHALALCCFIVLAVISAFRTFSMFEPPSLPSKEVEEERA